MILLSACSGAPHSECFPSSVTSKKGMFQIHIRVVLRRKFGKVNAIRYHGLFDVEFIRGEEYGTSDAGGDAAAEGICYRFGV